MTCAVRSCRLETWRRPDLSFFSLPREHHLKDEWLDVLGIDRRNLVGSIKVCELHFKPKDFCSGKKQLKSHAVPVLKLGSGKTESIDSDDEFMDFNSDGDDEIIEVPANKLENNIKIKQENIEEDTTKQEDTNDSTEGRRPSRRAAREAAKKIHNTVRSYMSNSQTNVAVAPLPVQKQRRRSTSRIIPIEIDLIMECHEEILSPAQAEALLKSQVEYNMVMKTLRSLKASNVKIICSKEPYPLVSAISTTSVSNVLTTAGNNLTNTGTAGPITIAPKPPIMPILKSPVVPIRLSPSS